MTEEEITKLMENQFVVDEDIEEICSICFYSFEVRFNQIGSQCVQLPGCEHKFHPNCIKNWLVIKAICPNCKRGLRTEEANEDY